MFEAQGRAGYFAAEPDFPVALENYRRAIDDARRSDPGFEPPGSYEPGLPTDERRVSWRRSNSRSGSVDDAFSWLCEITGRVAAGRPPIREADFHELGRWYRENEGRHSPNEVIEIGDGRTISRTNLRYSLAKGARASGVTELIEDLRRLRLVWGESPK